MAFNDGTCICIRGIPMLCTAADLDSLCRKYGRVHNIRVPLEPVSKGHRGYAFVTMAGSDEAQACIEALDGMTFNGCRLAVEVSRRSAPHVKTPGVYFGVLHRREGSSPGRSRRQGPSAAAGTASCAKQDAMSPRPSSRRRADAAVAEPLSEPATAAPAAPAAALPAGHGEPLVEPPVTEPTEPGGEPLIEEDPRRCAEERPKSAELMRENSPRSRISCLEEANIRLVGRQQADSLLLQFQEQGFGDPRAAAYECLKVSMELLGMPSPSAPLSQGLPRPGSAAASQTPQVLIGPEEFKDPSCFLRIYGDPLAASARRREQCQPESHQNGNWRCEQCSNVNFPRRRRCHKCHEARGPHGDAIVFQYCLRVHEMLQKGKAYS